MNEVSKTFLKVDDSQLVALIETTQERLVFMGPGLSIVVARAIADRWHALGKDQVKVILDVDPEVARLGFGSFEGLELIQREAAQLGSAVFHQPGIRIGVLIMDNSTIIFSPRPLLIEASSTQGFQPNAIWLDNVPLSMINEVGMGTEGRQGRSIGLDEATSKLIESVKAELQENPPQKFDITRTIRVFNNRFEFVEIEVRGCSISRKKAKIPPDLMAFIKDPNAQANLHSSYQIVSEKSDLSGKGISQYRKSQVDSLLVPIPKFGMVVLRENKDELLNRIEKLKQKIEEFQKDIRVKLQREIDDNYKVLFQSLRPAVLLNPPKRWLNYIGPKPSNKDVDEMLTRELQASFGAAETLIEKMEVRVLFKGITYEMLNDPEFIAAVHKAIPTIRGTHDEFEAARAVQDTLF